MATKLTVTPGPGCITALPDGKYKDDETPHLWLWVRRGGKSRIWLFRYTFLTEERGHSLGSLNTLKLPGARKEARAKNVLLDEGTDPFPRKPQPAEAVKTVTLWDDWLDTLPPQSAHLEG